jgi:hypothetical protein
MHLDTIKTYTKIIPKDALNPIFRPNTCGEQYKEERIKKARPLLS